MAWLNFIELDKVVVRVIRLASFLWLWFQCLPFDALSQHIPSYLDFSYLAHGVSLYSCCSKAQPLLLTLDEGYLLTTAPPDLERGGIAPLSPPAPEQPSLLGCGVAPLGLRPWPLGRGPAPIGRRPWPWARGSSSPRFCVVHRSWRASKHKSQHL